MAGASVLIVKVHLDIDLDGEPVTHIMKMPASVENYDHHRGLTVHLHLDEHKLAKALLPHLTSLVRLNGKGKKGKHANNSETQGRHHARSRDA